MSNMPKWKVETRSGYFRTDSRRFENFEDAYDFYIRYLLRYRKSEWGEEVYQTTKILKWDSERERYVDYR